MTTERGSFPAVHSTLCGRALAPFVASTYGLDPALRCQLLARNLNDTYLVAAPNQAPAHVLRVYRSAWRSSGAVAWELELLRSAAGRGAAVAEVVPTQTGRLFEVLKAVEGARPLALFTFVEGRRLATDAADGARYGAAAAELHRALDGFSSAHARFDLGCAHLLDEPLLALEPLLGPEQHLTLGRLSRRIRAAVDHFSPELTWAACHGDLHTGNARLGPDGRVRFFDFDCAAMGWRAYDLAVYWWDWAFGQNLGGDGRPGEAWTAFLDAYQQSSALSPAEQAALPWFVAARTIWFMGLMAGRADERGREDLGELFRYSLEFLGTWEAAWLR